MTMQNDGRTPEFDLGEATAVLRRMPTVLNALVRDLPERWLHANEGDGTWSPFDVVGHLVHGERADWMTRVRTILEHAETRTFEPFDRMAQFEASRGHVLVELLDVFRRLRAQNVDELDRLRLTNTELQLSGRHPDFGRVTLRQLLATWVVHDWDHLMQIERVLAFQYRDAVGPWRAYLRIVR
jgi:DinB family protein